MCNKEVHLLVIRTSVLNSCVLTTWFQSLYTSFQKHPTFWQYVRIFSHCGCFWNWQTRLCGVCAVLPFLQADLFTPSRITSTQSGSSALERLGGEKISLGTGTKRLSYLTLNLLTTTIVASPSNASKWQMGFNSAFKGLIYIVPRTSGTPCT